MKQHMAPGIVADMKKLCAEFWIVQMSIFVCCFKEMSVCNDKVYWSLASPDHTDQ